MRILLQFGIALATLFLLLLSSGCGDDTPGGGGITLGPVLNLNAGPGLVSGDQDLDLLNNTFIVNITGQDGDATLRDLAILENGTTIPASRLNYRTGQTAQNPLLIPAVDELGFTYEIEITRGSAIMAGNATYEFRLTDDNGEIATDRFTINYIQVGPTVEFGVRDGFVSGDATVATRRGVFDVRIVTTPTGADLASLAVLENGELIDDDRLLFNAGPNEFTSTNPLMFAQGEMSSVVSYNIRISPDDVGEETRTYTFRATAVNGVSTETSINVTFMPPPGTALTVDTSGVFFNASGMRLGGLDLDNAVAVAFNSPDAEIQDEGINLNASGSENWRAQISAANDDVQIRAVNSADLGDGVSYATILTQEEIEQAFNVGTILSGNDDFPSVQGDRTNGEAVSNPLTGETVDLPGEMFAVFRNDRYYLVRIDAVNYVADSNADNYEVSIKY